ncbi:RicAFT regulatory complex protein RicA family protein [Sporolactobacillus kofuensis]|uniref:RicAFT regulatory complex protein RicA family protein n=1 Tax=Sporolactobacillus kofuensis TaxID=269672 RepID=A0ABW1WD35_9BACL|nr:YlbF family regulator [Sporolactobacillus kofuensis]MCO7174764.1 YlbF family regulator [Sporolactobacillus kofuensis]
MTYQYSKEEILAKASDLAGKLSNSDQIRFYKQAESKISANQKVQRLVEQIKKYQKESVNLQHFGKAEAYHQNEAMIDKLQAELDAIPVVQEFKQSQEDVNDFLQLMAKLVSSRVMDNKQ